MQSRRLSQGVLVRRRRRTELRVKRLNLPRGLRGIRGGGNRCGGLCAQRVQLGPCRRLGQCCRLGVCHRFRTRRCLSTRHIARRCKLQL